MPADFSGKWILETNDKFEEYLKALSKTLLISCGAMKSILINGFSPFLHDHLMEILLDCSSSSGSHVCALC